uniref:Uncharacterized protein n=1 Tax=Rhizophora mucronata TaxID=61149 RepID=A0A2P2PBY5_RHIMU
MAFRFESKEVIQLTFITYAELKYLSKFNAKNYILATVSMSHKICMQPNTT